MAKEERLREMKSKLKEGCDEIPLDIWVENFPDLQIPLRSSLTSYHSRDIRQAFTYDEVHSFLSRQGCILVKLVHFKSNGLDSEKIPPDEILGEAEVETYERAYQLALGKLEWLKMAAFNLITIKLIIPDICFINPQF